MGTRPDCCQLLEREMNRLTRDVSFLRRQNERQQREIDNLQRRVLEIENGSEQEPPTDE